MLKSREFSERTAYRTDDLGCTHIKQDLSRSQRRRSASEETLALTDYLEGCTGERVAVQSCLPSLSAILVLCLGFIVWEMTPAARGWI